MKKILQLFALLVFPVLTFAQISFGEQQIISENATNNYGCYAFDLNNDGNLDVISAAMGGDKLAWYKGDGSGNFSNANIIATTISSVMFSYAGDLNGDEYLDIVACGDNSVYWYENMGDETFEEHEIITTSETIYFVYIADIDEDTDNDIIMASNSSGQIYIFPNIDGQGDFDILTPTILNYSEPMFTQAVDMDNDGDLDILSCSRNGNTVDWFENYGGGFFATTPFSVTTYIEAPHSVYAADIDNDSDIDVVVAGWTQGKIVLFRNEGGSYTDEIINDNAIDAQSVYLADLDNDDDYDILSASRGDDKIAWYKNNLTDGFDSEITISTIADGASMVYAADLDNDGDLDVLSASEEDNKIAWYENVLLPNIDEDNEPYNFSTCIGAYAYFSLIAYNAISYQWQVSTDGGANFFDIADGETYTGTTTDNLIIPSAYEDMDGNTYMCVVCNEDGCVESQTVTLTIDGTITIANAGENARICEQPTYSLSANPPNLDNGEYGYWLCENENVVFADNYDPQTIISNLPKGETAVTWIINSSFCISESLIYIDNDSIIDAFTPPGGDDTCEGGEYQLYANEPEAGVGVWSFSPESDFYVDDINNPFTSIGELPAGVLTCTWIIENGACLSSSDFILDVVAMPHVDLDLDYEQEITEGETINISAGTFTDAGYLWLPNGETTNSIDISQEGIYTIIVTEQGCSASDSIKISFKQNEEERVIPNAFTPNGDGINDTWKIRNPEKENIEVLIIDKNGMTVTEYTTKENNEGWDGTREGNTLPSDVYWYILNFNDGTKKTGTVTIKR